MSPLQHVTVQLAPSGKRLFRQAAKKHNNLGVDRNGTRQEAVTPPPPHPPHHRRGRGAYYPMEGSETLDGKFVLRLSMGVVQISIGA